MIEFHEVEFKYDATKITLEQVHRAMAHLGPYTFTKPTGWDYYFTHKKRVARFRAGELNEITIKKQTNKANNFIRKEVNLAIVPCQTPKKTLKKVNEFLTLQGYEHSFSIHKVSHIYFFAKFDVVYYVVKDNLMKEIGRFIEIEMDEHYPWKTTDEAYSELLQVEFKLKSLGLNLTRLNKSLFQLFHKEKS